jgi:enamine deaminase RidA (YjgF/YER057c/UK114 family)
MEFINPPFLARPVGYAHMSRVASPAGTVLLIGGVTGMDETGAITHPNDLVAQMDRALINLRATVEFAGGRVEQIARMRLYTTVMAEYRERLPELGEVWKRILGRHYPAMALLGVAELFDPAAVLEIECEAFLER